VDISVQNKIMYTGSDTIFANSYLICLALLPQMNRAKSSTLNYALLPTVAVVLAGLLAVSSGAANAQYGGGGASSGAATEQQLKQCEELGIERSQCNDVNILAKERLTSAQANPGAGSGTSMLSTETSTMVVFIGVLGAIFGGVAALFFFKGRGSKPITH
jgi:hypothetical protein